MSAEKIFSFLKDQSWHTIEEMTKKTGLEAHKLIEYSKFLAQKGIVKYEEQTQKIKIEPEWANTLPEENTPL